eukprot:12447708-Alexandrium_andersonii.AAC.1
MDRCGSGYAAASEIIDRWSLRLADRPELEAKFQEWCDIQHNLSKKNQTKQLQSQMRTIEAGGRPNRVRVVSGKAPRAPRGPGEAQEGTTQQGRLNLLLDTPIPEPGEV